MSPLPQPPPVPLRLPPPLSIFTAPPPPPLAAALIPPSLRPSPAPTSSLSLCWFHQRVFHTAAPTSTPPPTAPHAPSPFSLPLPFFKVEPETRSFSSSLLAFTYFCYTIPDCTFCPCVQRRWCCQQEVVETRSGTDTRRCAHGPAYPAAPVWLGSLLLSGSGDRE